MCLLSHLLDLKHILRMKEVTQINSLYGSEFCNDRIQRKLKIHNLEIDRMSFCYPIYDTKILIKQVTKILV